MRRGVALLAVAAVLTGCGRSTQVAPPASTKAAPGGTVTVLAAASLTGPFEQLRDSMAERYPDLDVVFSFGPSSALVEQVLAGAEADVLATADVRTMQRAVDAGAAAADPVVFARNALALVVPGGNPGKVAGLDDLAREDLLVALCQPAVPCGAAAERLLHAAGVTAQPDTLGTDAKDVLSLVELGEVDAALVYRTDAAAAAGAVEMIDVPVADQVVNDYPAVVLSNAPNPAAAQVVFEAITGHPGQRVLSDTGFLPP
ncbi:MAG: molybdate ABC transporter substrate-binding protein [Jiangellaceae bacterium]|nr:molybdate ABC transporter substrate-binding protein [Jiangellaceae bacterium]